MALDSKLLMNVIPVLCRLQDVAGYGVAVATTKIFGLDFPDRTFESPLVGLLMKNGRNGRYIFLNINNFINRSHLQMEITLLQVKIMEKDIIYMRKAANPNLIFLCSR